MCYAIRVAIFIVLNLPVLIVALVVIGVVVVVMLVGDAENKSKRA